jgi:hypothetical protein
MSLGAIAAVPYRAPWVTVGLGNHDQAVRQQIALFEMFEAR